MSPDPSGPSILLNAFCLLTEGLFVSSELPALEEPWSISSEGRVATASFADIDMKDPKMLQSTKPSWDTSLWSGVHRHGHEQISHLFHA